MAINPMIAMGVKVPDFDFSDRRVRNAHADLYEQQAAKYRNDIDEERQMNEVLKQVGPDLTPDKINEVAMVNPKAAQVLQGIASKRQSDAATVQKLQMEAAKEQRLAYGAEIDNELKNLKMGTEKASLLADLVEPYAKKEDLNEEDVHQLLGTARARGLITTPLMIEYASKPFSPKTREALKEIVTTGRTALERAKLEEIGLKAKYDAAMNGLNIKKAENEVVTGAPNAEGLTPSQVAVDKRSRAQQEFEANKLAQQQSFQAAEAEKNRTVTRRGQNMTDDRARDLNEVTRINKPATADENRVAGFFSRAEQAEQVIKDLEDKEEQKGAIGQAWRKYAPNILQSGSNQSYNQAKRQFTEAYLRRDSGAAIAPSEYENADKTFFEQAGDSAELKVQKRKAREQVLESLKTGAGRAATAPNSSNKPKIKILKVE